LGAATPSQVGLQLEKKKPGEKTVLEMKMPVAPPSTKLANDPSSDSLPKEPGEGRPKLSKDTEKRADRKFSPRTGAKLLIWATSAQEKISEIVNPMVLEFYTKKNLRTLSSAEAEELESLKTNILLNMSPYSKIDQDNVLLACGSNESLTDIVVNFRNWIKALQSDLSRELSMDEYKQAKASYYSMVYGNLDPT
jgi:hypothetical protein